MVMLLLVFVFFVFGILFTDAVTGHFKENPGPWEENSVEFMLNARFGTLLGTMATLFGSICGGVNWIDVLDSLASISIIWAFLFAFYMSFCLFAMLNVMTGVFCQGAIESAERDQEMLVHAVVQDRASYKDSLTKLFASIDDDKSGYVNIKEFEHHFSDESVLSIFRALNLDHHDAWELFAAIDSNQSGTIDAEEFLDGCMHLRGPAKAINLAGVRRDVLKIKQDMQELMEFVHQRSNGRI